MKILFTALCFLLISAAGPALTLAASDPLEAPTERFRKARALVRLHYCKQALEILTGRPAEDGTADNPHWRRREAVLAAECLVRVNREQEAQQALERLDAHAPYPAGLKARAQYLRAKALARLGRGEEAVQATKAISSAGLGVSEIERLVVSAEAASATKDRAAAESAWRAVWQGGRGTPNDRAIYELAQLETEPNKAKKLWATLAKSYPESSFAQGAEATKALEGFSEAERWSRATTLWDERVYLQAVAAFEPFAQSGARAQQANLLLGRLWSERLRDQYPRAQTHFAAARRGGDAEMAASALFKLALVRGKQGNYDGAISDLREYRQKYPKGADHLETGYEIGRHLMESGQFEKAGAHFVEWTRSEKGLGDSAKFLWFAGLSYFRGGLHAKAINVFDRLAGSKRTLVGDKARYFKGRSLLATNKTAEATKVWRGVLKDYPYSYYAWLAERQLRKLGESLPTPEQPLAILLEPPYPAADLKSLSPAARTSLSEAWDLTMIGQVPAARDRYAKAPTTASITRGWAPFLETVYADRKAAVGKFGKVRGQQPSPDNLAGWHSIFPLAYRDLAEQAGALEGVPPEQIYAHMLQESRYGERMVSGANAYGLIQILPSTARLISQDIGVPLEHPDQLFDPGLNVRMGTWYLGALSKRFQGQLPLSMAAYNGGPKLVAFHMQQAPGLDLEVLLESLPAHQSRNYARKVMEHMHRYAAIYHTENYRRTFMEKAMPYDTNYTQSEGPEY